MIIMKNASLKIQGTLVTHSLSMAMLCYMNMMEEHEVILKSKTNIC